MANELDYVYNPDDKIWVGFEKGKSPEDALAQYRAQFGKPRPSDYGPFDISDQLKALQNKNIESSSNSIDQLSPSYQNTEENIVAAKPKGSSSPFKTASKIYNAITPSGPALYGDLVGSALGLATSPIAGPLGPILGGMGGAALASQAESSGKSLEREMRPGGARSALLESSGASPLDKMLAAIYSAGPSMMGGDISGMPYSSFNKEERSEVTKQIPEVLKSPIVPLMFSGALEAPSALRALKILPKKLPEAVADWQKISGFPMNRAPVIKELEDFYRTVKDVPKASKLGEVATSMEEMLAKAKSGNVTPEMVHQWKIGFSDIGRSGGPKQAKGAAGVLQKLLKNPEKVGPETAQAYKDFMKSSRYGVKFKDIANFIASNAMKYYGMKGVGDLIETAIK